MQVKSAIPMLAVLVSAGAIMATGASASGGSALVIRHQTQGCHAWSVNGGPYNATQAIKLKRGAALSITNNDVMPHKLVETSGPAVTITRLKIGMAMGVKGPFVPAMLARMGSSSKVTFTKPGVYKFTTKAGEDYKSMGGMKTVGEDNVLRLTVTVS